MDRSLADRLRVPEGDENAIEARIRDIAGLGPFDDDNDELDRLVAVFLLNLIDSLRESKMGDDA